MELPYLYLTATKNKEFTGKSSLTSFCAKSSEKKKGWSTIFHELKSVVKAKIAQNNSQVSEGGIIVKPRQDSIHAWLFEKWLPVCRFCNLQLVGCMWSVKEMYHALLPKTDYKDKGRGHDLRLQKMQLWFQVH